MHIPLLELRHHVPEERQLDVRDSGRYFYRGEMDLSDRSCPVGWHGTVDVFCAHHPAEFAARERTLPGPVATSREPISTGR